MYTSKTFTPGKQMMKLLVLVSQTHYQFRGTSFTSNDGGKKSEVNAAKYKYTRAYGYNDHC